MAQLRRLYLSPSFQFLIKSPHEGYMILQRRITKFSFSFILLLGLYNVARGKETAQSLLWGKLYSWKAVDGNVVDRVWQLVYETYSCVYSHAKDNAIWWRVDFGGTAKIYTVKVYGRNDGHAHLDSKLKMRIGNKDQNGVNPVAIYSFSLATAPNIFEKTFSQPMSGRYLFIESGNVLSLCEVIANGYLLDF